MTLAKQTLLTLLAVPTAGGMVSCADNFGNDYDYTSEKITFTTTYIQETDSMSSRSASSPELVDVVAMRSETNGDSLFLEIYSEDVPYMPDDNEMKSRGEKRNFAWSEFGLLAYKYKATDGWNGNQTPNFAYNDKFTVSGSTVTPPKEYIWPGGKYKMRFFAVMPYGTGTLNQADSQGDPTFTYTVPTDISTQTDIMAGSSGELAGNYYKPVALKFSHPLATLCFKTDNTQKFYSYGTACGSFYKGTLGDLSINNIYGSATYNLNTGKWSAHSEKASYTWAINKSSVSGSSTMDITPADKFFFVIPQTAPDDAEIVFTLRDYETSTDRVFKGSLKGITWEAGKTYTYKLATTSIKIDYTFEVEKPDKNQLQLALEGGPVNVKVKSYKTISREGDPTKYVPINWTTSITEAYNDYTGKEPFGEKDIPKNVLNREDATGYHQCTLTFLRMRHEKALELFSYVANTDYDRGDRGMPYNLSSADGRPDIENTANCYVVDFRGWACFPAVFGPTYNNGNPRDYNYYSSSDNYKHDVDFFNDGSKVDCPQCQQRQLHPLPVMPMQRSYWFSPEISNYMEQYHPNTTDIYSYISSDTDSKYDHYDWSRFKAKLDWVEGQGRYISNVELFQHPGNNNQYYIRFRSEGAYCNAVISLYDNNDNRIWSWHIWCTDQLNSSTDVEVRNNGYNYTMAGVDLGWVPEEVYTYHDTQFCVQFTQAESNKKSDYIYVNQSTTKKFLRGHAPMWQFGRPTPLAYNNIYDGDGNSITTQTDESTTSEHLIERLYNNLTRSWEYFIQSDDQSYINIWSWDNTTTDYTANPVNKSLYDPCPAGYCMPSGLAYMAFGFNNTPDKQSNGIGDNPNRNPNPPHENAIELYTDAQRKQTVKFYGGTQTGNELYYFTSQGFVTFYRTNDDQSFNIYYDQTDLPYLAAPKPKCIAGCIRPVRER